MIIIWLLLYMLATYLIRLPIVLSPLDTYFIDRTYIPD